MKWVFVINKKFKDHSQVHVTAFFDEDLAIRKKKHLEKLRDSTGDAGLYEYEIKTIGVYTE